MNYETVTPALQKVYIGWYDRSCCSRLGSLGTSFCCMIPELNDKKSLAPQWLEIENFIHAGQQVESPQGREKFNMFKIQKTS